MLETKASLLIVDDEPSIRATLSQILTENGYGARSAGDGLSALDEIHREAPEVLISDLNMPGMSGFELLPVVRGRFPRIHLIAMSGAYSGSQVPPGVTADAFYQKGSGINTLLRIMESLPRPKRMAQQRHAVPAPVWIARSRCDSAGENHATIECPECLGSFSKVLSGAINPAGETTCIHCGSLVRYEIVQAGNQTSPSTFLAPPQRRHSSPRPALTNRRELAS
jgi:CheY-like chemotaxis protein